MAPPLPAPSPRPGALLPTPSPVQARRRSAQAAVSTPLRTPTSNHRLHFPPATPRRNTQRHGGAGMEHPVEVIGRVRNLTASAADASALDVLGGGSGTTVRVRGDRGGCRDFSLDGVSVSEEEDLEGFYRRFVRSRIQGVRTGAKCTVMVYGLGQEPQHVRVRQAARDRLPRAQGHTGRGRRLRCCWRSEEDAGFGVGLFVQVAVLEIYNVESYDLLVGSGASTTGNTPKEYSAKL